MHSMTFFNTGYFIDTLVKSNLLHLYKKDFIDIIAGMEDISNFLNGELNIELF